MFSCSPRLVRRFLLSASSLALLALLPSQAAAQNTGTPPQPPAAAAPPSDQPATPQQAPTPVQPNATPQPSNAGGNQLPETHVAQPVARPRPRVRPQQVVAAPPPQPSETEVIAQQNGTLDTARQTILAPVGTSPYQLTQQSIQSLPQGSNAPLDKVLLQTPGVSQDSAASGELHVRNEHGNVQYRINGIMLPDGVGAFGQILDTGIVGSLALITGALPAQFGLRTAGVVDIQTSRSAFNNTGAVGVYGGSRGTITPSAEYGATVGNTQYYVSGRYFGSNIGLENPTPANSAIHDHTDQGKGFAYLSTIVDPSTRVVFMSGVAASHYQIPNTPGATPNFTAFGVSNFDSATLDERQRELNQFNVLALQHSAEGFDVQAAYFNRTSVVHFMPDLIGDLVFNGVASDVYRRSMVNGIQTDAAYRWADAHTLRTGFVVSAERSLVRNSSVLEPLDDQGNPVDAPFGIVDESAKTGWLFGTYLQDEWKITNQLTLNAGVRFDQIWQYVNANQLSPRISLTYTPFDGTVFHAGYARYFTPPPQVLAAPTNLALVQNTTQQPAINLNDQVQPERAHYFDVGVTQRLLPGLNVGIDAYYKLARDLLDDGQFGAALVLTAFNYDRARNAGVEVRVDYTYENFRAYANLAYARQVATTFVSNEFLFAQNQFNYVATHYIATDHAQLVSGSAGVSWLCTDWLCGGTRFSMDMIFGSGLRRGFANLDSLPPYYQFNLGIAHEFKWPGAMKPTTLRFDVVNVFDRIYEIRDGSGIGVFAPQFGPRRGFFVGLSQKI